MKKFIPFIVLFVVILADQSSKIAVRNNFAPGKPYAGQHVRLIGNFFWINFHENTGVAFGMFSKLPRAVTIPLFSIITLAAIFLIFRFYKQLPKEKLLPRIALMMIVGGAIGNLLDRLILGKVTDFLDIAVFKNGIYKNIWPIFNLADCFIVIGVIILLILMLFEKKNSPAKNNETQLHTEIDSNQL